MEVHFEKKKDLWTEEDNQINFWYFSRFYRYDIFIFTIGILI